MKDLQGTFIFAVCLLAFTVVVLIFKYGQERAQSRILKAENLATQNIALSVEMEAARKAQEEHELAAEQFEKNAKKNRRKKGNVPATLFEKRELDEQMLKMHRYLWGGYTGSIVGLLNVNKLSMWDYTTVGDQNILTYTDKRNFIGIAKMKLIPIHDLINGKSLLLIDDSIVRGTQLRETTEFLYQSGAKEVHIRPACPPLLFGCKYLNFSRTSSEMELITRRVIKELEGRDPDDDTLREYADPDSDKYKKMVDEICRQLHFTTLRYNRLDDLIDAVGIGEEKLCTYCWSGKE